MSATPSTFDVTHADRATYARDGVVILRGCSATTRSRRCARGVSATWRTSARSG